MQYEQQAENISLGPPVVVGRSRPNETRWGFFQFPSLFRLPGGELMVTVNDAEDATSGYGRPLRRFMSLDEGFSWRDAGQSVPGAGPHASCVELFDGEYLILAATAALDLASAGIELPPAVGTTFAYHDFHFYRVAECPAPVRDYLTRLPAWRWSPRTPSWTPDEVVYDVAGHLCYTVGDENTVSRTWFEHPPVRRSGELLYVDYRTNCLQENGAAPGGFSCILMVSGDNAHTFRNRSVIAAGRVYEPMLADTADGGLVCVIRGADHEQRPMLITHSRDDGHTWETPRTLFDFGVFPALVRLDSGVLLLAFGRPGVWVSASLDGTGRTWTDPVPVIEGDSEDVIAHTCGYTNLLPLGPGEALLVYSDFKHVAPDGTPCKSVEVRRVSV
ncbi:MAG: exo-alpha-sialidase [Planctomycetes bacterium]|nr:exo-alpha-sialidase [Planctomycetota bacterium]